MKHILVVDDEAPVRLLVQKILESAGYRVTGVANGNEALRAAREDPPDLAVCDLSMPGLDGFTVCSMLKRSGSGKAPVLVLSGRLSEKDVQDAQKAGADTFITKPVERAKLLATVAEWLVIGEERAAAGDSES